MRAIIIEEARFGEIRDLMKAECERLANDSNTPERLGWPRDIWRAAVMEAFGSMNFNFVRWAQSHGASCGR